VDKQEQNKKFNAGEVLSEELLRKIKVLTLILLTWRIWWAPNNASKWQM